MRNFRNNKKRSNDRRSGHHAKHISRRPSHHHHSHSHPLHSSRKSVDEAESQFLAQTAIDPSPRIHLASGSKELTMRAMDMICPIGMGQRGLIVAPPGSGKTTFLKHICQAISAGHPEIKLYCLLIDERPEEVTDFRRSVPGEIRWSSSDETYEHHIEVADKLMREAFKEASAGENVVVVIDSLTRLARVHNAESRSSGRTLSGGVDARAMEIPRRIFGAARKIENGGSLSILATILKDTGSRMDEVIFEEFKGTGNMEIVLSREISDRRIFPAIDIQKSRTRKEELLLDPKEYEQIGKLRNLLADLNSVEAAEMLVQALQKYSTNEELLMTLND